MQLDMFSAAAPQAVDLRTTPLPHVTDVAARIGSAESWATLTLDQVLTRWYSVYDDFVQALEKPIAHAKSFCKENGANYGAGGPLARQFYQREYQRLTTGLQQLSSAAESQFCDNLTSAIRTAQEWLRAEGATEDDVDASDEFFNQVIQQPGKADLPKLLPVLMRDLAAEFLRLQS